FRRFGGNLLILGAAVAFMIYGILSSDRQQRLQITPLALTYSFVLVTMILCIPFAIFEIIRWPLDPSGIRASHILATIGTGLLGTAIFYMAYQKAIQLASEVTASLFTYLQPIATIIFAVILVGEAITLPFVIGGTLAVIGAGMATNKT
ncbi:DMT family transporter, partial [bacterium]|nr:DMT family transporter [bacterium]